MKRQILLSCLLVCLFSFTVLLSAATENTMTVKDFALMNQLRALYVKEKFDFVFHYTIKPVIYGSIAARLARVKHISVITGLGYTFLNSGFLNKLVISLYRFSLKKAEEVWFLNEDDREVFLTNEILKKRRTKEKS